MITGLWGKKVGMTQLFAQDKVVPVTVIDLSNWVVTGIKTIERDGYAAVQVARIKARHQGTPFSADWIKQPKIYFNFVREIHLGDETQTYTIGQSAAEFLSILSEGDKVAATGITKGHGFAGVIRRHGFNGPPGSHGSDMGKRPGSSGAFRSQGRVIKGKRFPGHMGNKKQMTKGLTVVRVEPSSQVIFVKGAVPGKAGSLIFVEKHR